MQRYLIIGNGVAGTTAAEQIRKHDTTGEITIITDEALPFYYRIRLNEYLSGDLDEAKLLAKAPAWYEENSIRLLTATEVINAEPDKKIVSTGDEQQLRYDSLLIATGGQSFVPPIDGAQKEGVFTLRTMADARQILAYSASRKHVLLIGGGLLGLEAGNALRKRGKQVTVVEFFPRLLPRQLDDRGASRLKATMEEMGFSFILGASIKKISGENDIDQVVLDSDETIPTDMVIISAGIRPRLTLAHSLGLTCERGIIVDRSLRTSRAEVFAAGDVAEFDKRLYGIWPAAMEQGKVAGMNMAGGNQLYQGTTMANKLKVAGIELAAAGEIDAENQYEAKIVETDTVYKKYVIADNHLIGCIMLGDTSNFYAITRAITAQTPLAQLDL